MLETKIISFWGKGGVGKTTLSAVTAYFLAKQGYKTLLVTNDLTPSLSDLLSSTLSYEITKTSSEYPLYAIEITEEIANKLWKDKFGKDVYEVISSFLPVDESIIDYVAGAPMISDEFILAYILELKNQHNFDFIVWDTAPAGGTLRLIKLEKELYEHLGQATKLYLSMKSFFSRLQKKKKNPLELIDSWRKLADNILRMVSDKYFFAYLVTIPEWLGYTQLKRIYSELTQFSVPINGIIINQIITETLCKCEWVIKKSLEHKQYISKIKEEFAGQYPVFEIPYFSFEIKNLKSISKMTEQLGFLLRNIPL